LRREWSGPSIDSKNSVGLRPARQRVLDLRDAGLGTYFLVFRARRTADAGLPVRFNGGNTGQKISEQGFEPDGFQGIETCTLKSSPC
jgi:hypothetical protein